MEGQKIISLNNVSIYQKSIPILQNVSFSVEKGELVYLIGKTGSGKSSILKTLYADLPLTNGEASVGHYNLNGIKRGDIPFLRRELGIVFQDFQLLTDRTVKQNLEFVMKATGWKDKKNIEEQVSIVLEMVGLKGEESKYPHQLSGGEQQRVAIARALVNNPDIILADEPTGNLDPETANEILQLLWEISRNGRAVLIATHDYHLMRKYPARTIKCEDKKAHEIPEHFIK